MQRITWLDASRGLAILLLIAMHYTGALESRNFISKDALNILYSVLRLATPFFMFTFGLAFYITASKKVMRMGISEYYAASVLKSIIYIFIGRETIVLILSFRYPEMAENFWSILLFQEFAKGGEILIFYFFAFLVAPLNLLFIQRVSSITYAVAWLAFYFTAYSIGANFVDRDSHNVLRFLFFDIYAFFPFLFVVATAMLVAKSYLHTQKKERFIKLGLLLGTLILIVGFLYLTTLTDNIWRSLANAEFKAPPHPGFMLFYLGEVFIVISLMALIAEFIPRFIFNLLTLLGRNGLVSYVVHYTFYFSVPLAAIFGGGVLYELLFLFCIFMVSYFGIKSWDARKQRKKLNSVKL